MAISTPIPFKPTGDAEVEFNKYLYDMITSTTDGTRDLRESKIKEWRDLTEGKPREENRSFPWKNASNLVVQIVGTYVDTLLARIMGSIYEVAPIWPVQLNGDWKEEDHGEEQRDAIEKFLNLMALEPEELDLYRVESVLFEGAIKYGTMFIKEPWETLVEAEAVGMQSGKTIYREVVKRDGVRPEVIQLDKFLFINNAPTLEDSEFKAHIVTLRKYDLLNRKRYRVYESTAIDKILSSPDRGGPSQNEKDQASNVGINFNEAPINAEWDLHECHFNWMIPDGNNWRTIKVIATYHYKTKTLMRCYHTWYPNNEDVYDMARLGYTDKGILGYGYAEMLKHYQEEVTGSHNRRADNETLNNTSMLRIDPSRLADAQFSIYPMAILPFGPNEIEVINVGRPSQWDVNIEQQILALAKDRAGIDPGVQGAGSGQMNVKKGIYSAMGTFAVLQAGNRRTNLKISDMRYTHVKLGRKFLSQYAKFGVGHRLQMFGEQGKFLVQALKNYREKRISLSIRAASASINKEVEKQNDMMMVNLMRQHYMSIGSLLQSLLQAPPPLQDYIIKTVISSDYLMKHVLQNFGYDDVSKLIPESNIIKQIRQGANNGSQNAGAAGNPQGNSPDNVPTNAGVSDVQNTIPQSGNAQPAIPVTGVQ